MASMVHPHHHPSSPASHSHPHQHSSAGHAHAHPHGHGASSAYSYTPSDFDLLKALTSGAAGKNTAKKALRNQQQSQAQRRPQLDPLILETAASSGPHVTRNHFLHEFYPHPEDPSSAFSWHTNGNGVHSSYSATYRHPSIRRQAYARCDVGPEEEASNNEQIAQSHRQGALEQEEYPTASTSNLNTTKLDPNTASLPRAVEDDGDNQADDESGESHALYRSRQAPRKIRLERERIELEELEKQKEQETPVPVDNATASQENEAIHANLKEVNPSEKLHHSLPTPDSHTSIFHPDPVHLPQLLKISQPSFFHPYGATQAAPSSSLSSIPADSKLPLQVVCYARTRVPTPHGEVFLHLYKNNWDDKEHLAFVFDRDQLLDSSSRSGTAIAEDGTVEKEQRYGTLRSRTLDSVWRQGETDVERIVRGAYVGRLSPTSAEVSKATEEQDKNLDEDAQDDAVLVRIHSECFTGETIGSQRCDCGEQLDEAFRLIGTSSSGLGIIIYLRQEGRGIGLLEKIKAYNLQDLGHDTVTANLLLGHGADQRNYALAGEMLRDLGVGTGMKNGRGERNVRLLTNNPDKIDSIEKEGIKVVERVPMVPRGWTVHMPHITAPSTLKKKSKTKRSKQVDKDGKIVKGKKSKPRLNMQDSTASLRSTVSTSQSPPLLSPALSSSATTAGMKPKNKKLEALKPLSSSYDADGIRSVEASASEAETEDDIGTNADSYEMPSLPGSADERDSLEDAEAAIDSDEDEEAVEDEDGEDSEDSAEREEALEDYLISMNRTGVGMIGAGVTHSKELERYLKTKIERMGHMLIAPAAPPSTPLPLRRGARIRSSHAHPKNSTSTESKLKNEQQYDDGDEDRLAGSIIKTDEESIKCDQGAECEDCQRQRLRQEEQDGYFADEIHGEDMFG